MLGEEWGCKERDDIDLDDGEDDEDGWNDGEDGGDDGEDDGDDAGEDDGDDDEDDGDDDVILQKEHWKYLYGSRRRMGLQGIG